MKLALARWRWRCSPRQTALVSGSGRHFKTAPGCAVNYPTQTSLSCFSTIYLDAPAKETSCRLCTSPRASSQSGLLPPQRSFKTGFLSSMLQQRLKSTSAPNSRDARKTEDGSPTVSPDDRHEHPNNHSHSHSVFRTHSHHDHDHTHGAEQIIHVLEGKGDRGSQITLLGLLINVGLTGAKGVAGWYMHSASLLADAGHSLSDLLGDFVTLFCWKLSRKPPSERYPYGFAKFETFGTTIVSILLIGGALGIGFHSYHLLMEVFSETASTLPPGQLYDILQRVTSVGHHLPSVGHAHTHVDILDPNAAWFAAFSVLIKEWLYRITKKVADEEHSPVLYANAVHHRSDAYSSFVALFAILGSSIFPALPLDPLGGLLVSFIILQQGVALLGGALAELTDAGVSKSLRNKLLHALDPLVHHGATNGDATAVLADPRVLAIRELRARRTGSLINVDLSVDVPHTMTVLATSELEVKIIQLLRDARKEVSDVRIKFRPVEDVL